MRTLIVEDDFLARTILSTLLSDYGTCHLVIDGSEAVAAIEKAYDKGEQYDLVCLDIMMPVMNGQEALSAIRKNEDARGIAIEDRVNVIMVTALDDEDNRKKAEEMGCKAYLTKPLEGEKVVSLLKDLELI